MTKRRHKLSKKTKIILAIIPIVLVFAGAFLAQKIYAYSGKNEFNANGIRYYDPEECNKDGGGKFTKLPGDNTEEKIWNYLISLGFNDAQTAGLMGNFEAESGNNPVREVDNNCWGLAMICRSSGQYESSRQAFQDAGLGQYVGHPTAYSVPEGEQNIPEGDLDAVIQLMVDWIIKICDENRYIYDGTYTEWIKTAQTPEEAAEIFTVTYERPVCHVSAWGSRCVRPQHVGSQWDTRYDGYQDLDRRREHARGFYDKYSGNGTSVSSTSSALGSSTGGNVTMIGDSITNMSTNAIKSRLPDIDIHSQGSKHMFMQGTPTTGGDSGAKILADIVQKGELRDVLVVALGTNDPGALTQDRIQTEIVDKALNEGGASKVIFVNNAEVVSTNGYIQNNDVFTAVANANPDVEVADWAAIIRDDPGLLNSGDVHPTGAGMDRFSQLIYDSVGSLLGSLSSKSSGCNCAKTGSANFAGGLTEEQAEALANDYNTGAISRWSTPGNETYDVYNNCVSFSKYITRVMTDLNWGGGNGRDIVNNMKANNPELETGTEPRPFAIFSTGNHTGFVVAVNGDDVMTVESAWPYAGNPQGHNAIIYHKNKANLSNGSYSFVYIEDHLDAQKFGEAIGGGAISTTSSESAALVNVSWQDGWITQGIEGYVKETPDSHGVTPIDNSPNLNYTTQSPKNGTVGPNKITLHSVEGHNDSSGIAVYNASAAPLSHFTIDLKNKKTYQHLPINKPACGVASHDQTAGVQIEIMGFSTSGSNGFSDDWYLENDSAFGAPEWAYLGKLLVAISEETGIPLTSDVDWSTVNRLDATAFADYEGVLGHRHVPNNDHTDPGNIWSKISEQLDSIIAGQTNGACNTLGGTWSGNFPFLFQCESSWKDSTWSGGTFCNAGCGVTSMAMVVSALTGELKTPPDLTSVIDCDTTASGACLETYAQKFNLQSVHFSDTEHLGTGSSTAQIKQAFEKYLNDGYIVITSGYSSSDSFSNATRNPFSNNGHYIVFYGIDNEGNWLIADPGGKNRDWAAECTEIGKCTAHDNGMVPEDIIEGGIQRKDSTGVRAWAFKK